MRLRPTRFWTTQIRFRNCAKALPYPWQLRDMSAEIPAVQQASQSEPPGSARGPGLE